MCVSGICSQSGRGSMRWNSERQRYEHKNLRILKEISVRKRIPEMEKSYTEQILDFQSSHCETEKNVI